MLRLWFTVAKVLQDVVDLGMIMRLKVLLFQEELQLHVIPDQQVLIPQLFIQQRTGRLLVAL